MIVGIAAEQVLCTAASEQVRFLSGGQALGQTGLWADRIRSQSAWAHTAPWHYVNVPDNGDPRSPPPTVSGNVVAAIERFSEMLKSPSASSEDRRTALRFLVHFVADIHQPLHVGRAADRGGNQIEVSYSNVETNLHLFWDTDAIAVAELTVEAYAASIADAVRSAAHRDRETQVRDWAEQVFRLRAQVYDFDQKSGALEPGYLAMATATARRQLILAAAHLAVVLNRVFCDEGP